MRKLWNDFIDMPPVWLVFFLVIVWLQTNIWNPLDYSSAIVTWIGRAWIVAGLFLMVWSFLMFQRHKTSVIPKRTPKTILKDGPYRFSRNPIYVADTMILLGFVLIEGSVLSLTLIPLFMRVIRKRFIDGEEAHILAGFGAEFEEYRRQTRRWL